MLLDILQSTGFGAVLGGIFGYLNKREERANIQMKFEHDINMLRAKTNAAIETARLTIDQAKVAGSLAVEKVEAQAFKNSQTAGGKFAEGCKAVVRPVILFLLMYQTYRTHEAVEALTDGIVGFSPEELLMLYKIVTLSIISLTSTAVSWYFCSRSTKQFDKLIDKWHT